MKTIIDRLLKFLIVEFVLFVLLIIALFVLGYFNVIPNGIMAAKECANTAYIFNVATIVLVALAIWTAVRLFVLNTEKNIKRYTLDNAVKTYHVWSVIRLLVMFLAITFAICTHFLTKEDIGLFCSIVLLLMCVIYCIPSRKKITDYLDKVKGETE